MHIFTHWLYIQRRQWIALWVKHQHNHQLHGWMLQILMFIDDYIFVLKLFFFLFFFFVCVICVVRYGVWHIWRRRKKKFNGNAVEFHFILNKDKKKTQRNPQLLEQFFIAVVVVVIVKWIQHRARNKWINFHMCLIVSMWFPLKYYHAHKLL